MEPPALLIGDRYQLSDCIAVGGMGEVWRATDLVLGRAVAVKLLRSGCDGSEEDRARFRAEARHAGSLAHAGIARVYDYREADPPSPSCLVMELVDGSSLSALLDEGPMDPARTMGLIAQVAAALEAAHAAGLVHRDIKPGNLLVSQDGNVKITDFGIAYAAGSVSVTSPGTLIGTPAYLAPERAAGAPATPAADLYALGVVAYQCLTGRLPFEGEPLAMALAHLEKPIPPLPTHVPAGVAGLVADLTAKDPRARPASAGEVAVRAGRLRDALTGTATDPPGFRAVASAAPGTDTKTMPMRLPDGRGDAPSGQARPRRSGRRNRRVLAGLNAVLVLAMTGGLLGAGWLFAGRHGPGSVLPLPTERAGRSGSHATHPPAGPRTGGTAGAAEIGQVGRSAAARPPSSSPTATAAGGRGPTRQPTPGVTRSPNGTPSPGRTPAPSATPTQTGTPAPSATPTQTGTPAPTATPTQGGTPAPTVTPTQTGTPQPEASSGLVSGLVSGLGGP
jgi:hypothetical protein